MEFENKHLIYSQIKDDANFSPYLLIYRLCYFHVPFNHAIDAEPFLFATNFPCWIWICFAFIILSI